MCECLFLFFNNLFSSLFIFYFLAYEFCVYLYGYLLPLRLLFLMFKCFDRLVCREEEWGGRSWFWQNRKLCF